MKNAILLSGGLGTRLNPLTQIFNKQLIPLGNKFIIDYPLQTLKDMGCQNVSIVLGNHHFDQVLNYCQDGSKWGMHFNYVFQKEPKGIAQAISLCERFVKDDEQFTVILGDNFFKNKIKFSDDQGAEIVLVKHPELHRLGVASLYKGVIAEIEEKPLLSQLNSNHTHFAITGCYKFDYRFFEYFKNAVPSARGEYEITDMIKCYWRNNLLNHLTIKDYWGDVGTFKAIEEALKHI